MSRGSQAKVSAAREMGSEPDGLALLKADHAEIKRLLKQLNEMEGGEAKDHEDLLNQIETKLKTHTAIEEQILYPAFKRAVQEGDKHLYFEAVEEHGLVDIVLPELMETDLGSHEFKAKAKVLLDLVEHHSEEEESEMFPRAKKAIGAKELRALSERMAELKSESGADSDGLGDDDEDDILDSDDDEWEER